MTSEVGQRRVAPQRRGRRRLRVRAAQLLRLWRAQRARPPARAPRRASAARWTELVARRPVRGLGRDRPRRDPLRRSSTRSWPGRWSADGQLGRHRPAERRLQAAGRGRPADPRRRLGRARRAGGWSRRPAGSSTPSGDVLATAEARLRRGRRRAQAPAAGALRDPARPADASGPGAAASADDRDATTSARSPPGPIAFVADRRPEAERARRGPRPSSPTIRTRSPRRSAPGSRAWPIRSTSRASVGSRPGSAPTLGVRWPLIAAVERGFREATRRERTSGWLLELADRLFARARARGALVRLRPARAARRRRPGARLAAPAPGGPRGGDWITVDTPRPPCRPGHPRSSRTAGPSSSSSSTRRRAGSGGSSARTIATLPFVDRRPRPRARGRRPRPRAHRRPDRRRRAGRPEGAGLGPPVAGARRPCRDDRRSSSAEARPRPPRPTTATGRGSSATRWSSSTRPTPTRSGPSSTASAAGRARRDLARRRAAAGSATAPGPPMPEPPLARRPAVTRDRQREPDP